MRAILILFTACALAACTAEDDAPLVAADVVIYQAVPGSPMRAGYLTLTNNTNAAITINRIASPEFASVEMHESLLEDGIAKMRALPNLPISAGETVRFEKGGKHLMLMQPVGDFDSVTLQFYSGNTLLLDVVVEQESTADGAK
jgi:hypothetical protein